jgi:hypothetical protein
METSFMCVFQSVIILMVDVTQCMVVINQNKIGQGKSMNKGTIGLSHL